jgi:hypothetical protein
MRLGTAALTLAVGLSFVGLASADESPSWWTRFWPGEKTEPVKKLDIKIDPPKMPVSTVNNRVVKAKADLERRQDICLKLRELAIAGGDDDLLRKAELLDQRAYDLYVASTNQRSAAESVKKGDSK